MTLEPGHEPIEWGSVPRPTTSPTSSGSGQPVHYNSARHGNHVEESPELLRWRADLLMDEMMMGGVDLSAADGNRTFSGVDAPIVQRSQPLSAHPPSNGNPSNGNGHNGDYQQSTRDDYSEYKESRRGSYDRGGYAGESYDRSSQNNQSENGSRVNGENGAHGYGANGQQNGGQLNGQSNGQANGYAQPQPTEPHSPYGTNGEGYPNPASRNPINYETPPVTPNDNVQTGEPRNFGISDEPREYGARIGGGQAGEGYRSEIYRGEPKQNENYYDDGRDITRPYDSGREVARPADDGRERGFYDRDPQEGTSERFNSGYENRSVPSEPPGQPTPPTNQANNPPPMATRPPLPPVEPVRQPMPTKPPRVTPPDEHTQWAVGPDKWEYQDFAADPETQEDDDLFGGYPAPERKPVQDSAVRQDPAQFVSAMSVVGSSKKRSTLLPRSTELDIDNLHREISDLHGEIAALLPVGNETSERARHLLDKAYSILQSDPSRSAEVEYYMQQVRTIVQRLHQARQWSDLYRKRLHLYLWGWLGLSAVMLIATFLFQNEMEEALMWLVGIGPDSVLVENWTTFLATAFAGALGGAIGALYTMQRHARGEHSFFDRKYGLRGLLLPFMGLIVGALGYLLFGLVFALLGVDPSENLTVAIIPMVAAFAFGFSQESIYGTRD